ncbi:TadE/TadG family type IV pilus assembly protein [Mesorhizobium australicum]|uniref:Flp pilus assembly protein TadG n=1 Tax=Mesorhizobium australicum TaxID=536018 RepID=A0A1X7NBU5_9HYPH|nr:TadE/TadG family type IV pilus assembly protein [Mesorhizobium australicum]SMH34599.1 Flp pilus assembly protein TadG [Mesorhizobium australicum]
MTSFAWMNRIAGLLRRAAADRKGVAAIEFAFIAPLLLTMYFVTMEIAPAIDANKKVGRAASMIADLVTQQQSISKTEVEAIMSIGEATLNPYSRTQLKVVITAIRISNDDVPTVTVAWSRKMVDGAFSQDAAKDSTTTVPETLRIKGSFLIRVETSLDYRPIITWTASEKQATGLLAAFDNINMQETYYLRPRMSTTIDCSTC